MKIFTIILFLLFFHLTGAQQPTKAQEYTANEKAGIQDTIQSIQPELYKYNINEKTVVLDTNGKVLPFAV
jgi:hypothetical protein